MVSEHYCGGTLVEIEIAVAIGQRDGRDITVFVPGQVCRTCGREQFTADVASKVERAIDEQDFFLTLKYHTAVSSAFRAEASQGYAHVETYNRAIRSGAA